MLISKECKIEAICPKGNYRPTLENPTLVKIDGRMMAVSSNGHAAAFVAVEADESEAGYIPIRALKEARKIGFKHDLAMIVLNGDCRLADATSIPRPTVDDVGNPPAFAQVIPENRKPEGFAVSLNAETLYLLAQALGARDVTLRFSDNLNPFIVTDQKRGSDHFGVMMPMRTV